MRSHNCVCETFVKLKMQKNSIKTYFLFVIRNGLLSVCASFLLGDKSVLCVVNTQLGISKYMHHYLHSYEG